MANAELASSSETPAPSLRDLRSLKDIPGLRQLALLIGLSLAIAAGISLYFWSQKPNFAPLYTNLADKDSAEIVTALQASGVEFRQDPATGAITVPADKVYEARLKLASQGLPKGTAQGMELIQQEQGFGTSQFIENARYQLALETELARTVGSLLSVKSARVHLALPKPSAFARPREQASASVVVELYPGRELEPGQVASIVHVVSSSVPNLQTSAVTVVDQYGHLLTQDQPNSDAAQSAEQFKYARRVEGDYIRRIEQLLLPMMGTGRVSAQVAADLDFDVTEEAREAYNPNPQAIRSEQTNEESSRGQALPAQGIPGATSNQPPSPAQAVPLNNVNANGTPTGTATTTEGPSSQTRSATRNFELDKTISHTRQSVGRVRRLSVAVLVDHIPKPDGNGALVPAALTPEELQRVEALVKEAVGFDERRGDTVTVQNAPFLPPDAISPPPPLPLWQRADVRDYARQGLGALILLLLGLMVVRPMLKSLISPQKPAQAAAVEGVLEAGAESAAGGARPLREDRLSLAGGATGEGGEEGAPAMEGPQHAYEKKLVAARAAVAEDPKRVAQLVKLWIGSES